jgi:hypothetical protein
LFYFSAVQKFLGVLSALILLAGCSDQLENENVALKAKNRELTSKRITDATTINLLSSNLTYLKDHLQELQLSNTTQIADQRHAIAALTAETVRQKEELENMRRTMADEKALFEKYKEQVSQQLQKPGRVKVTLTFKNDAVGTRSADNGATVSLHSIKDTTIVYRGVAGADGVVMLDRVKPGKYLCVIHSGNAHQRLRPGGAELVRQHIWKTDRTMLTSYLDEGQITLLDRDLSDSDASGHFLEALLAKTWVKEIEVAPQETVPITCDFGQAAF